jgi:hypothetical protein
MRLAVAKRLECGGFSTALEMACARLIFLVTLLKTESAVFCAREFE